MAGFENFINEAKKIANMAVDKTEEVVREGKNQLDIKGAEYDIKKLYEKIGKACYEGVKNDTDNSIEISEIIEKIDELYKKIDELKSL